jgi:hypothetical protein
VKLIGAGRSDGLGAAVTSVKLVDPTTNKDYIVNGDFAQNPLKGGWSTFRNGEIKGWSGEI